MADVDISTVPAYTQDEALVSRLIAIEDAIAELQGDYDALQTVLNEANATIEALLAQLTEDEDDPA